MAEKLLYGQMNWDIKIEHIEYAQYFREFKWNKLRWMMHDGMVDQYYTNYIHAYSKYNSL